MDPKSQAKGNGPWATGHRPQAEIEPWIAFDPAHARALVCGSKEGGGAWGGPPLITNHLAFALCGDVCVCVCVCV